MGVVEETAAGKFVEADSKKYDWCDDETFAEIKKKFGKDGVELSGEDVGKLVEKKGLRLGSIVGTRG